MWMTTANCFSALELDSDFDLVLFRESSIFLPPTAFTKSENFVLKFKLILTESFLYSKRHSNNAKVKSS